MEYLFKVLFIGDVAVGKTSFVRRYAVNKFNANYKATIGVDFVLKVIKWSDNCTVKLQLWDVSGQENCVTMTRAYYRGAHACVIMFDLTRRHSLDSVIRWKNDLDRKCVQPDGTPVPCLLVANKCDLEEERTISQKEVQEVCQEHDFLGWVETSVKEGLMINDTMNFVVEEILAGETLAHFDKDSTDAYSGGSSGIVLIRENNDKHNNNNVEKPGQCSC